MSLLPLTPRISLVLYPYALGIQGDKGSWSLTLDDLKTSLFHDLVFAIFFYFVHDESFCYAPYEPP